MARLPRFTLSYDQNKEDWRLRNDQTQKVAKRFETKEDATKKNALKKAIGGEGSVRIEKVHGGYQEERTFPRSKDPRKSPG